MQQPYIPAQDASFDLWSANFSTLITDDPTTYGLVSGDAVSIAAVVDPWHDAYVTAVNPATRTPAAIAAKDAARTACEAVVRPYAQQISRNPAVTNDDKIAVGVNLPNTARTPIPPPTTVPALSLVNSIHFQQTLAYRDTATPTSKAKPPGAIGCDMRMTLSTAPATDPEASKPLTIATKSPVVVSFTSQDVGKFATYWGRWSTRSGPGGQVQYGDWSAPLTVVVT